jgi:hypothetical protein
VKLPVRVKTGTLAQLVGIANYKGPTISLQQMKDVRRPRKGNESALVFLSLLSQ